MALHSACRTSPGRRVLRWRADVCPNQRDDPAQVLTDHGIVEQFGNDLVRPGQIITSKILFRGVHH